jgi:hypothetical protein
MHDLLERSREANPVPWSERLPVDRVWRNLKAPSRDEPRANHADRNPLLMVASGLDRSRSRGRGVAFGLGGRCGFGRKPGSVGARERSTATACTSSAHPIGSGPQIRPAGPPDPRILKEVAVLRQPASAHDRTIAAWQTSVLPPTDQRYVMRADPAYVRYAGRGVLVGQVFAYATCSQACREPLRT